MLREFMTKLSAELEIGIEGASEKAPGVYHFPLDDILFVELSEPGAEEIQMRCVYPENPLKDPGEFYTAALVANLYGRGTDRSLLGLDSEGKKLTLSYTIDYNADYKEFKEILEDFLNSADFWSRELAAYGTKPA